MGIKGAGSVYEHLYGQSERVITSLSRDVRSTVKVNNVSIDIVDMLTISIPCCRNLATKMATAIATSPGRPLGQLIVFFNPVNNIIHEIVYDANLVVRESDLMLSQDTSDYASDTLQYRQTLMGAGTDANVFHSVCSRASLLAKANPPLEAALVAVNLPSSHHELERLVYLAKDGQADFVDSPNTETDTQNTDKNMWYVKQGIREGRFIKFSNIHQDVDTNEVASETIRFRRASIVQDLEGLVLLYAWEVAQRLSSVLVKQVQNHPDTWRCLITVNDGISPPLKNLARVKRFILNERRTMTNPDSLMILCEQLLMKLQSRLASVVINDIIRIPLANVTRSKTMYTIRSNLTEAENDMVCLAAMFTGLQTPAAWSDAYNRKMINQLEISPLMSSQSSSGLAECNFYRRQLSWTDVYRQLLNDYDSNNGRYRPDINLYSTDSDVLGKWNMVVAHHRAISTNEIGRGTTVDKMSVRPHGIFFYRNLLINSYQASVKPSGSASLAHWKAANTPISNSVRYDLLQSPIYVPSEMTMLIMLTKGSDYNDPIVSPRATSQVDVRIRDEMALFLSGACRCLGGWKPYAEAIAKYNNVDSANMGLVCADNVADDICPACGKSVVLPFWTIKAWFVGLGSKIECNIKSNPHILEAINCAGNIMAILTMGAFNRAVYGSPSIDRESRSSPKRQRGPVSELRTRMNCDFNRIKETFLSFNTPGGVPVNTDALKSEYRNTFGSQCGNDEDESNKNNDDTTNNGFDNESEASENATVNRILSPCLPTSEQMVDEKSSSFWLNVLSDNSGEDPRGSNVIQTIEGQVPNPSLMSLLMGADISPSNDIGGSSESTIKTYDPDLYKIALSEAVSSTSGTNILTQLSQQINRNQQAQVCSVGATCSEKCVDFLVALYLNMVCYEDPAVIGKNQLRTPMMHTDAISNLKPADEAETLNKSTTDLVTFNSAVTETVELLYSPGIGPNMQWPQESRNDWTPIINRFAKLHFYMERLISQHRSFMAERIDRDSSWIIGSGNLQPLLGFSRNRPWTCLSVWGLYLSNRYNLNK
nr:MAG: wsv139-like protein [Penaeus semisulcatus pemonivirus]